MSESHDPAFVNGHIEPSVEFDYAAVDRGNPLAAELERSDHVEAAQALVKILEWIYPGGERDMKACFVRFTAAIASLRPEIFENASYAQIGKSLGCSKAYISHLALEFQDKFGVHFRRSRRESARKIFKNAQLKLKKPNDH